MNKKQLQSNHRELQRIQSIVVLIGALVAGFMNLGAIYGFLAYGLTIILFHLCLQMALGRRMEEAFEGADSVRQGFFNDFSWYLLCWTVSYNLLHII